MHIRVMLQFGDNAARAQKKFENGRAQNLSSRASASILRQRRLSDSTGGARRSYSAAGRHEAGPCAHKKCEQRRLEGSNKPFVT
jgi:hypothetical protein